MKPIADGILSRITLPDFSPTLLWIGCPLALAVLAALWSFRIVDERSDRSHRFPTRQPHHVADLPAEVAGDYFKGGRGDALRLRILADGRYSCFVSGHSGVTGRENGFAQLGGGIVVLRRESGDDLLPVALRVVPWNDRVYLVPLDEMTAFCDAIVAGEEPRTQNAGAFLLKDKPGPVRRPRSLTAVTR